MNNIDLIDFLIDIRPRKNYAGEISTRLTSTVRKNDAFRKRSSHWINFIAPSFRFRGTENILKPRPNDRKMSTQHIANLLGATCWVCLASLLRRDATSSGYCWLKFDHLQTWANNTQHVKTRVALTCCDRLTGPWKRWFVCLSFPQTQIQNDRCLLCFHIPRCSVQGKHLMRL